MLKTIILLTGNLGQQRALAALLREHNPALSFRDAVTRDELLAIPPELLRDARLVAFTTGVVVPEAVLERLGHGAYNFHPGPPDYPGWAPAHFAMYDGAKTFGATAHVMVRRVDSGPIVASNSSSFPTRSMCAGWSSSLSCAWPACSGAWRVTSPARPSRCRHCRSAGAAPGARGACMPTCATFRQTSLHRNSPAGSSPSTTIFAAFH
jgi:hypothetical protein